MAHDDIDASQTAPRKDGRPAGRMLLFGGVAAACVAGAGLGLWARPVDGEQPAGAKPAPPPAVEAAPAGDRRLHVVVDDAPAPIGKPLEVLPAPDPSRAGAPIAPEPQAAKRPPLGLMRIAAPALGLLALPMKKAAPAPEAAPAPAPAPVLVPPPPPAEAPKPLPVTVAKVRPAPKKPAEAGVRLARAEHVHPAKKTPASVKLAKAEPKHAKPKVREVEVAEEAPPPKPRRALLALAHVIEKVAQRHPDREDDRDPGDRGDRGHDRARKPVVREVRVSKPAARPKAAPKVERYIPPLNTKGAGPIKVTNVTTRCASPDPGEALACGDPSLAAAQRRLNRAYAEAVAAGVSPSTLEQQQQRWLAARAAAAREAPWAVREVYQARIAELQDQTRDARGE